jgi:hypothetical protein
MKCAFTCKNNSDINSIQVEGQFQIFTNDIYQPIQCPLCRQEEKKMSLEQFKQYYPDLYNEWFQLELNCDDYGYSYYLDVVTISKLHTPHQTYRSHRIIKEKPIIRRNKSNKMFKTKGKRKI